MRPALTDRKGSAHGRYSAIMPSSADWRSTAPLEMMRKKNVETLNNTLATAMKSLQLSTICHILGNMWFDPQLVLCANERHQYTLCWRKSLLEQAPVVALPGQYYPAKWPGRLQNIHRGSFSKFFHRVELFFTGEQYRNYYGWLLLSKMTRDGQSVGGFPHWHIFAPGISLLGFISTGVETSGVLRQDVILRAQ